MGKVPYRSLECLSLEWFDQTTIHFAAEHLFDCPIVSRPNDPQDLDMLRLRIALYLLADLISVGRRPGFA
jgi:hypothetical protein